MNIELHLKVTETWTLLAASVSLKCLLAMVCYLLCLRQGRILVFNVVDKITNIAAMKTTWSWVLRRKIVAIVFSTMDLESSEEGYSFKKISILEQSVLVVIFFNSPSPGTFLGK